MDLFTLLNITFVYFFWPIKILLFKDALIYFGIENLIISNTSFY